MINKDDVINAEKDAISLSFKIAKEKQKLAEECFKIIKIASVKNNEPINESKISERIYEIIKDIDNTKIISILDVNEDMKLNEENKLIMSIIDSINQ